MIKVKQVIKNNVLQTTPTQLFNSYEEVVTWLNANLVNIFSYTGSAIATTSTTDKWIIDMYCLECDTTKDCLLYLIQNDQQVKDALCANQCLPVIPSNVTNLTTTDSNGWTYDCWNPILNWISSSWATSYDIFEWATLLWNTVSTTFTVSWASVWSHTYTVIAKNSWGSASWINVTVVVAACLTIPNPITNLTSTDTNGWVYDCWAPILNWTASAWATSYDIIEWTTLIANVLVNTYTFAVVPSVWNHTYTIIAKNWAGSSAWVSTTVNVANCLTAPWNVTGTINVYNSGTTTNYTCGLWFDVDFTDVSWATYYQLFEWATQIWSNSATSNFVVTGQTAGSHTYTIKACNWAWCSTGTNFTVSVLWNCNEATLNITPSGVTAVLNNPTGTITSVDIFVSIENAEWISALLYHAFTNVFGYVPWIWYTGSWALQWNQTSPTLHYNDISWSSTVSTALVSPLYTLTTWSNWVWHCYKAYFTTTTWTYITNLWFAYIAA